MIAPRVATWHPEPELISVRDPARSREALRAAGAAVWETALDYLYDHAFERAMDGAVSADRTYGSGGATAGDGRTTGDQVNFWRMGFEGTRRCRALKLWLSWKHVGSEGFARLIEASDDLAVHLAARVAASDDFELLPPEPDLSVVCFRHLPNGRPAPAPGTEAGLALDEHQDRLQAALEASGEGWLTTTRLRGATYLRAGIVNTQSTVEDVDELLDVLRRLAADA